MGAINSLALAQTSLDSMPLSRGTKLTIISGSHEGRRGYLHTHVHQTPGEWPQVLHHYYRITLVDGKGSDAQESVLVQCHQVRFGW